MIIALNIWTCQFKWSWFWISNSELDSYNEWTCKWRCLPCGEVLGVLPRAVQSRPSLQHLYLDSLRLLLPGCQEQGITQQYSREEGQSLNAPEKRQAKRGVLGQEAAVISDHGLRRCWSCYRGFGVWPMWICWRLWEGAKKSKRTSPLFNPLLRFQGAGMPPPCLFANVKLLTRDHGQMMLILKQA